MQGRKWVRTALLLLSVVALAACGSGNQPGSVTWRNVTFQMPDGWYVFEEEETRLSISNQDIGPEAVRTAAEVPEGDVVAMYLTYEPETLPDDWRDYAEAQDATVETDDRLALGDGDIPATRLIFNYVTDGIPLREMVVVIPSRDIVVLAQPVPRSGQQDGPEVFLEHVETFVEVLDSAEFGRPVDA